MTVNEKIKNEPITLEQLGELLVKHYKLNEGLYQLSIEFGLGVGNVMLEKGTFFPGIIAGIKKFNLVPVEGEPVEGTIIIDAGKVNPKKQRKKPPEK
jgi:hypothetical protein